MYCQLKLFYYLVLLLLAQLCKTGEKFEDIKLRNSAIVFMFYNVIVEIPTEDNMFTSTFDFAKRTLKLF